MDKLLHTLGILLACTSSCALFADDAVEQRVSFRTDIAPILQENCLACHGPRKSEGGYRVDSYAELLKPGDSGETPVAASKDLASEVLRRVTSQDESERMPAESEPLTPEQIDLLRGWIESGARFDGQAPSLPLALVIPPPRYADPPQTYLRPIPITALAFSPDAAHVLASGYHEVTVWKTSDHALARRIRNIGQRVYHLAFSADGKTLAVACGEPGKSGEVRLVDFDTGEVVGVVARSSEVALDVAFRPGSNTLAVASADSLIRLVDAQTQTDVRTIASHADCVTAIAWSEDGSRLASASRDKSAKVYDGSTGELLSSYLGHGAAVRGVAILAGAKQVVSVGGDGKLHRWNIDDAAKIAEVEIGKEGYQLIRDGNDLFVPCADQRLLRIDLASNSIGREFRGHSDWVLSAAMPTAAGETDGDGEPVDRLVLSGSFDGELRLWNLSDGSVAQAWTAKP
jgi:WD40 repeat protein